MKLSFTLHTGNKTGSIREVRNFREGRYVVDDAMADIIESTIESALDEATFRLNSNEPDLKDPRLIAAIGTTAYWTYELKRLKKSGSRYIIQMVVKNTQPDGVYYAQRRNKFTKEPMSVPIIVGNLALVKLHPPLNYIAPTGYPREAPADFISFYVGDRYIRAPRSYPKGGHERYRSYIIGTVRQTIVDAFQNRRIM